MEQIRHINPGQPIRAAITNRIIDNANNGADIKVGPGLECKKIGSFILLSLAQSGSIGSKSYEKTFTTGAFDANKKLVIIQAGAPGAGQIGPHKLNIGESYDIEIWEEIVGVYYLINADLSIDLVTGNVTFQLPIGYVFYGTNFRVIMIGKL